MKVSCKIFNTWTRWLEKLFWRSWDENVKYLLIIKRQSSRANHWPRTVDYPRFLFFRSLKAGSLQDHKNADKQPYKPGMKFLKISDMQDRWSNKNCEIGHCDLLLTFFPCPCNAQKKRRKQEEEMPSRTLSLKGVFCNGLLSAALSPSPCHEVKNRLYHGLPPSYCFA